MWDFILPFFGFLIGIIAAMTGVGGGVFYVPLLTLVYGFVPSHAVGTSLFVIIFGALGATVGYARQKRIFFKTGLLVAAATIPGSVLGVFLTSVLSGAVLGLVFGVFLIIVALRMIFVGVSFRRKKTSNEKREAKLVGSEHELFLNKRRLAVGVGLSFFGGLASGLLGIGGGALLVPIMALVILMPIHVVVATSMFAMFGTAISGAVQHYTLGNVDLSYGLLLAVGAFFGTQVGAWLCKKVSGENLQRVFAVLLIVASIQMIMKFI